MRGSQLAGSVVWGCVVALAAGVCAAEKDNGPAFFETHIRPLLSEHCLRCHGEKKQEGELRLDRWEGMLAGGGSGPIAVAGKPDQSLLLLAVRQESNDLKMPPEGKLTDKQIGDLRRWIEMGLPHPDKEKAGTATTLPRPRDPARSRSHWAFQPVVVIPPPVVTTTAPVHNAVDAFLSASIVEQGLHPAAAADRRFLIRRATFDLLGLPPTVDDYEAFQADDNPDAFARLVDRLLTHPAYGERWGRHWLDVARYADSNGLDENIAHGNAWRYRDYVIRAFNADKPFDEFVLEQLAGDALATDNPQQRNEQLIATGLLSLGPKVLAEVDEKKMEMDIVDEQIDTVGRAFLGLTLGCARCHDHKFDPLTMADYYGLAGVFQSTHTMDSFTKIAKWHEHPLTDANYDRLLAEFNAKLQPLKSAEAVVIAAANAELQKELGEGVALPAKPEEKYPPARQEELQKLRAEIAAVEKTRPTQPSAMGVKDGKTADLAIHLRGSHLALGDVTPRQFPAVLFDGRKTLVSGDGSGREQLARWLTATDHPLTSRVLVNRVWHWHFGRGLVPSTDNLGLLGERPTHPALLDWLAGTFVREGWSLKRLHRRLLESAAYQRSGETPVTERDRDPENRWLARFTPRRLSAEEIRDAILTVSNGLDPRPGGPALAIENRKHIFDHTSKDDTQYASQQRSVYLPIVRNHLCDVFTLFDYADDSVSTSARTSSTVASQALFLLNGELTLDAADRIANRVQQISSDDEQRIAHLYRQVLGRPPQPRETTRGRQFVAQIINGSEANAAAPERAPREQQAWRLLAQTLLISNEMLYVR